MGDKKVIANLKEEHLLLLNSNTGELEIVPSEQEHVVVEYDMNVYDLHEQERDGVYTLTFSKKTGLFLAYVLNLASDHMMKVYLPKRWLMNTKVQWETGDVRINNLNFNQLDLDLTIGDLIIENVSIDHSLVLQNRTGDVTISKVKVKSSEFNIVTGDVSIDECSFNTLIINQATGDFECSDYTGNKLKVHQSTGDAKLADIAVNELFLNTSTGDCTLSNVKYSIGEVQAKLGEVSVQ